MSVERELAVLMSSLVLYVTAQADRLSSNMEIIKHIVALISNSQTGGRGPLGDHQIFRKSLILL